MVTERLADSLDIQRRKGNLVLSGIGNRNVRLQDEVTLEVSPESSEQFYLAQVYVIPKISSHVPLFDVNEVKSKYTHLRDVNVNIDIGSVDLLIGQNSAALLRQLEARYGDMLFALHLGGVSVVQLAESQHKIDLHILSLQCVNRIRTPTLI